MLPHKSTRNSNTYARNEKSPVELLVTERTSTGIAIVPGHLPELEGQILLLKTPHDLGTGLGGTDLQASS